LITITMRAKAGLSQYLKEKNAAAGMAVKLVPLGRGELDMVIDLPAGGDEVVCRDEKPILIVDRRLVEALNGAVFDLAADLRPGVTPEFTVATAKGSL
jgi:Fe-S cluster assembly iron-binding protein IscA